MASSSTRSTLIEHQLYYQYRIAHARMYHDPYTRGKTNFITECFAKSLDIAPKDLAKKLAKDHQIYLALDRDSGRYCLSDRVYHAGNAFADAGTCLEKKGRVEEAGRFCEWAHQLWELALDYYHYEKSNDVIVIDD